MITTDIVIMKRLFNIQDDQDINELFAENQNTWTIMVKDKIYKFSCINILIKHNEWEIDEAKIVYSNWNVWCNYADILLHF